MFLFKVVLKCDRATYVRRQNLYDEALLSCFEAFIPRENIRMVAHALGETTVLQIHAANENDESINCIDLVKLMEQHQDVITLIEIIGVQRAVFEDVAIPEIYENVCMLLLVFLVWSLM